MNLENAMGVTYSKLKIQMINIVMTAKNFIKIWNNVMKIIPKIFKRL
jgi:hypothetical protein